MALCHPSDVALPRFSSSTAPPESRHCRRTGRTGNEMTTLSALLPRLAPHEPEHELQQSVEALARLGITTGALPHAYARLAAHGPLRLGRCCCCSIAPFSDPAETRLPACSRCVDVDLLFAPSVPPRPGLTPAQVDRVRTLVAENLSAVSSTGLGLWRDSRRHRQDQGKGKAKAQEEEESEPPPPRFSTSLEPLDDWLDGGLQPGEVVQLTGPRRSGRTALALYTLLLHLLLHPAAKGAWFDSTGSFDPHRCLAILREVLVPRLVGLGGSFAPPREEGDQEADKAAREPEPEQLAIAVLDRLAVSRVIKASEVLDVLSDEVRGAGAAEAVAVEGDTQKDRKLDMVVIDSLDNLLGGEALAKGSARGETLRDRVLFLWCAHPELPAAHAALIAFMRRLGTLARSPASPLAILAITTTSTSDSKTSRSDPASASASASAAPPPLSSLPYNPPLRPAFDDTFAYLVDLSLLVTPAVPLFGPVDGRDRGFVEVIKNTRGQEGGLVPFELVRLVLNLPFSRPLANECGLA